MINKIVPIPKLKQGFTLIETLAAIMLLSIAIVGPMTIAEKGLSSALISKDQDSAFYLAQDAIEFIRYARDTNCLASGTGVGCPVGQWLDGGGPAQISLTSCVSPDGSKACAVDSVTNSAPVACAAGVCSALNYDSTKNWFTYNSGSASIYTRTVKIVYDPNCSGTCNRAEADVTVTVAWMDPAPHSITVKESMYDWQ